MAGVGKESRGRGKLQAKRKKEKKKNLKIYLTLENSIYKTGKTYPWGQRKITTTTKRGNNQLKKKV